MTCASFPKRYLGVPLTSKKLSPHSCQSFLQQVKTKFNSWIVKTLSFIGHLHLIKTLISGISTFWCSYFILPKACIKAINSTCGAFLWSGGLEGAHSARVSWEKVTNTKDQGDLSIRDLTIWNKAGRDTILQRRLCLGCLVQRNNSEGINQKLLDGKDKHKVFLVCEQTKARDMKYPLIECRIGNGLTTSFRHDT